MSWKHIIVSVVITVMSWPFAALIVVGVLLALPAWIRPSSSVTAALCFFIGTGLTAYILGNQLVQKQATLHGTLAVGIALPTAALSVFLLFSAINFYTSPPSDWQLIRRFERNEALFAELRDAAQVENGLAPHHKAAERLGISSVNRRKNPVGVYFELDKTGFNTIKYYVYRQIPPPSKQIVTKIGGSNYGVYRPIAEDWYLYAKAISN